MSTKHIFNDLKGHSVSNQLLTVMEGVDGVNHELEQSVPEVAAGVQDGNVGRSPPRVLPRHHAGHRRARHASLEEAHFT